MSAANLDTDLIPYQQNEDQIALSVPVPCFLHDDFANCISNHVLWTCRLCYSMLGHRILHATTSSNDNSVGIDIPYIPLTVFFLLYSLLANVMEFWAIMDGYSFGFGRCQELEP